MAAGGLTGVTTEVEGGDWGGGADTTGVVVEDTTGVVVEDTTETGVAGTTGIGETGTKGIRGSGATAVIGPDTTAVGGAGTTGTRGASATGAVETGEFGTSVEDLSPSSLLPPQEIKQGSNANAATQT